MKGGFLIRKLPHLIEGCKAQIADRACLGAQISAESSQNSLDVKESLAGLRFDQRGKLDGLAITCKVFQ
jgi:hypothetical protein